MVLGFARWTRRQWRGEQRMTAAPAWMLYGMFWVIMAFWVARNIPGLDLALTRLTPARPALDPEPDLQAVESRRHPAASTRRRDVFYSRPDVVRTWGPR